MPDIDFTATTVGGVQAPKFRYWYRLPGRNIWQVTNIVELAVPSGTSKLRFIPLQLEWTDINKNDRTFHYGFHVEFEFGYQYISAADFKDLIKVFSWRAYDIDSVRVQCFPHKDLKFNFFGRFIEPLLFNYVREVYLAHSGNFVFRSTDVIQDIPRITANNLLNRRIY